MSACFLLYPLITLLCRMLLKSNPAPNCLNIPFDHESFHSFLVTTHKAPPAGQCVFSVFLKVCSLLRPTWVILHSSLDSFESAANILKSTSNWEKVPTLTYGVLLMLPSLSVGTQNLCSGFPSHCPKSKVRNEADWCPKWF